MHIMMNAHTGWLRTSFKIVKLRVLHSNLFREHSIHENRNEIRSVVTERIVHMSGKGL